MRDADAAGRESLRPGDTMAWIVRPDDGDRHAQAVPPLVPLTLTGP